LYENIQINYVTDEIISETIAPSTCFSAPLRGADRNLLLSPEQRADQHHQELARGRAPANKQKQNCHITTLTRCRLTSRYRTTLSQCEKEGVVLYGLRSRTLNDDDDDIISSFYSFVQGFSVEGQENEQEILSKRLYLCQFLGALMVLRTGRF